MDCVFLFFPSELTVRVEGWCGGIGSIGLTLVIVSRTDSQLVGPQLGSTAC